MNVPGLITIASRYSPTDTLTRLLKAIGAKGLTVFARVDHAAGAAGVGMSLRPTELVIFGNAKGGTPLMQQEQTIGIDLPLKALVWEGTDGQTWLSYNDPAWIVERHNVSADLVPNLKMLNDLLSALAREATAGA